MKSAHLRAAVCAGIVMGLGVGAHAADITMKVSHQLPPQHPMARQIDAWAESIRALSDQTIDVQVFPTEQLFRAGDNYPAVAKGDVECAFSINSQWGATLPEMNFSLRPYSVTDMAVLKNWDGSQPAQTMEHLLREKGVHNVAWFYITNMSAVTSSGSPLIKPEDYKGKKIRGLGPLFDAALAEIGAAPVAMSGSEVYQALQTRLIDAGITDFSTSWVRKYYEVQDHIVATPMFSLFYHAYCNPRWYDALTDAQKAAIVESGQKVSAAILARFQDEVDQTIKNFRDMGFNLYIHTPEEIEAMKAAMLPAFDRVFNAATGDRGEALIDEIERLADLN